MLLRPAAIAALALPLLACSSGPTSPTPDGGTHVTTSGGGGGTGGAAPVDAGLQGWAPGVVRPGIGAAAPRGFRDLRGIIHAHSVYSHDACDDEPRDPDSGAINEPCFQDLRAGICHVQHDFLMLSDHSESFARTEFPDVLLYRPELGDTLIERNGGPVANRAACPGGGSPLLLAGTETGTMPVGLEGHVPGTVAERQAAYGDVSADAIQKFKAQGAVSLMQHTEDWTVEQLTTLPVDGFEMYNLHANLMNQIGGAVALVAMNATSPESLPHPDLVLLPVFQEDPRYLSTWAAVLAGGVKRVTTLATDSHRNSLQAKLPDGERIDSYRRMMLWFSNHLLVKADPGGAQVSDTQLKEALRAGRLYGAFEVMGYPLGFDYRADEGGVVREMGEEASIAKGAKLLVTRPHIDDLDPGAEAPKVVVKILRADASGWVTVAEGEGDLAYSPTQAGAYRAEVRMTPRHLRGFLSSFEDLADKEFPWVYANAVYVVD